MTKEVFKSILLLAFIFMQQECARAEELFSEEIKRVLNLSENEIDTGIAALTFAQEIYPSIHVEEYSRKIDVIVTGAKKFIERYGRYDPDSIIRAMNTYYYREWGVQYDKSAGGREYLGNYFINSILDNKTGQCLTIPMLYMSVAQRLGYPVYAVVAPEHNFLRFVDPNLKEQNIELSGSAGYSSDADYSRRLNISQAGIDSGAYLRTLTRREYLAVLLQQNAIVFMKRGNVERALLYFKEAYKVDRRNVYSSKNLSLLYGVLARKEREKGRAESFNLEAVRYGLVSERLGWTTDPDANSR